MPASGVWTHTTERLVFDRDTNTPCTPAELPSLATRALMIAARSERVAGLADELLATAAAAAVNVSAVTATVAMNERSVTTPDRSPLGAKAR
jgi:hypothetical protein